MLTYSFDDRGMDFLYEHLYKEIKNDILMGNLKAHEKLPSKRALAAHLNVSVVTVENAYSQLLAEGYIYSKPKSGFYVCDVKAEDADVVGVRNAYYASDTDQKIIYLTFDAGYENGNTPAILDALKKHQVKATFFVVGTYIDSEPELIRQITKEGHTVGNHTWHHPDMSHISSIEDFQKELEYVETAYKNVTGKNMTKYYRPPQGKYSEANLQMAKELGYKSFFWSLAYVDWYQDNQPSKEEAFSKLLGRIHPGAIVLLHSTSSTNAEILDELLTRWEEMGYHVQPLENIISTSSATVQQHT